MQGILCRWSNPWRLRSSLRLLTRPPPISPRLTQVTAFRRVYSTSATSPQPIRLRQYQVDCLEACTTALRSGLSRIGISLPTGSGKTTIFLSMIPRIPPPPDSPHSNRVIIVVSSEEIAHQVASQARDLLPDLTVEIEQGCNHASGEADITVGTYQSLMQENRLAKYDRSSLKAVIVDEAHHSVASSIRRLLSYFNCDIPQPVGTQPRHQHRITILGFSATFSRADRIALGIIYEAVVFHRDIREMMQLGFLCNLRFTFVHVALALHNVKMNPHSVDFNVQGLAEIMDTHAINKQVVQTYLDKASDRKSTLAFCVNMQHVQNFKHMFREAGIDARSIDSGTPSRERERLVALFKVGAFPVLVNCGVFTEGVDVPNIDCIILASPTRSKNRFIQQIGRGLRPSLETGKKDCLIIDFVDSGSEGHMAKAVSIPTLFGLPPPVQTDKRMGRARIQRANARTRGPRWLDVTDLDVEVHDLDDPFSLRDSSGAPHLKRYSRYAWVGCDDEVYLLPCPGLGQIEIRRVPLDDEFGQFFEAPFEVTFVPAASKLAGSGPGPARKVRWISERSFLTEAVKDGDRFARTYLYPKKRTAILREAPWRQLPPSESQLDSICEFIVATHNGKTNQDQPRHPASFVPTQGDAANLIIRIRHGARVHFEGAILHDPRASAD